MTVQHLTPLGTWQVLNEYFLNKNRGKTRKKEGIRKGEKGGRKKGRKKEGKTIHTFTKSKPV